MGETFIPNIGKIRSGDLDVNVSSGFILRCSMGSAIKIRQVIEDMLGERALIYTTISAHPLFLVKRHDLSQSKQDELNNGRKRYGENEYFGEERY